MSINGEEFEDEEEVPFRPRNVGGVAWVRFWIGGDANKGFPTTNFTLTVQEDGVVVWETMQTSEKSGIAFWRGEFDPKMESMRGVVSYQPDKKSKQDYSFTSAAKKTIPAPGK